MGKQNSNKDKEWKEVIRLRTENQRLRRENSKLRKVIKNVDFERYSFVQDLLVSLDQTEQKEEIRQIEQSLEDKWKCHECKTGILRLTIIFKAGKEHYFRKCDNRVCGKKTKLKEYHENVEGVK